MVLFAMRFPLLLIALLSTRLASAAAEVEPIGNRFQLAVDKPAAIKGLDAGQTQGFSREVGRLVDILRAQPAVANSIVPLCRRVGSKLDEDARKNRVGSGLAFVGFPYDDKRDPSGCKKSEPVYAVNLLVNNTSQIFSFEHLRPLGESRYYQLPIQSVDERLVRFGDKGVILTRNGKLPWRPVDRRAYLQKALAQAKQQLTEEESNYKDYKAMSAAMAQLGTDANTAFKGADSSFQVALKEVRERFAFLRGEVARKSKANWICLGENKLPSPDDACADDRKLMEPDPKYWDQARPDRIQLLMVQTDAIQRPSEPRDQFEVRMNIWESLDWPALLDTVMP